MKTKSQVKAVERFCREMLSIHSRATREQWSSDQLIKARSDLRNNTDYTKWTRVDHAYIHAYSMALYDIVWANVEWRLGTEETGPVAAGQWLYGEKIEGMRNLPTHGGHFWKGTDKPFTAWSVLSPALVAGTIINDSSTDSIKLE